MELPENAQLFPAKAEDSNYIKEQCLKSGLFSSNEKAFIRIYYIYCGFQEPGRLSQGVNQFLGIVSSPNTSRAKVRRRRPLVKLMQCLNWLFVVVL